MSILGGIKAGNRQVEVDRLEKFAQFLEITRQYLIIPAGVLNDTVICDHEGALLRVAQPRHCHGGDGGQAEQSRRLKGRMALQHEPLLIDQNRNNVPEGSNALRDLLDLAFGMYAGVPAVDLQ